MENGTNPQSGGDSKAKLVEQINSCLRSGDYARALDFLRNSGTQFAGDTELSAVEARIQEGLKRKTEADRLITESQELFAQQKSAEAIQLLRKAYELDQKNSLARAILANALVEQADSIVETDWLGAETMASQALAVNPAHPTAKSILNVIVEKKRTSTAEDWVARARKLQSAGDLFGALAWVAEGLAVHPNDAKLVQIQDEVQRDQAARRRQARRRDLEDLRKMELEIGAAADDTTKQALAERIQGLAAKYWTDGEMLSIANVLLNKLGLAPQQTPTSAAKKKSGPVIFHVPRSGATKAPTPEPKPLPAATVEQPSVAPKPATTVVTEVAEPSNIPVSSVDSARTRPAPKRQVTPLEKFETSVAVVSVPSAKLESSASPTERPKSNLATVIVASAAAIVLVAASFFFARKHQDSSARNSITTATPAAAPTVPTPESAPVTGTSAALTEPTAPETAPSHLPPSVPAENSVATVAPVTPPLAGAPRNTGALVIVAGQDDVKVSLNGKLKQLSTQGGQLRLPDLEPREYVVQVFKNGFQNPPQQKVRIRKGEEAKLVFNLQPQPSLATLSIQGGTPGASVLVDQSSVGTIQADGTFSIASINPGDHIVELRKDRYKPRQLKKHFAAGSATSVAASEAALEGMPGELKINFTPADANVAVVKGDLLKFVSSGVPLALAPGTYTLTARTAERFTRTATFEVSPGQSKSMDLSLAPNGMSKWEDAGGWKREKDSFVRKGGEFVLYGVVPSAGTFSFSAMATKGRVLQWVINYTDPKNYMLVQMDDSSFYRAVIRNGEKTDEIRVPDKEENKKSFRTIQIRVSGTEVVHQVKHGDSWSVLDRWTHSGTNPGAGKFGFYIPGNDQISLSNFSHYGDLNLR